MVSGPRLAWSARTATLDHLQNVKAVEQLVLLAQLSVKNIGDILHKDAGCTSELDYTEQSSWLLFLKYLDALEQDKAAEADLEGRPYTFILGAAYRWATP